ncbi:MAG: M91 family zinc metallopeptidase [Bacteroidia bacterium]
MNVLKTISRLKILLMLQFFSIVSFAGTIRFHNRMQTSASDTIAVNDTLISEVNPKTGNFSDVSVVDILTVGIDPNYIKYLGIDSVNYKISLRIDGYDAANNLISTSNQTLTVIYNPIKSAFYKDQSIYVFKKAYKYRITYLGAKVNGITKTKLPGELFIDGDIEVNRYYNFASVVTNSFTLNPANPLNIDCDANTIYDELNVSWNTCFGSGTGMVCPESYDFEWTFINDYDTLVGLYKSSLLLNYDFVNNSTRVNVTDNFYRISLIYEHGYILYRVRGVGVDPLNPTNIVYGAWSLADNGTVGSVASIAKYYNTQEHEAGKDWQYNASFAEEGKKKEVLAYYDGSLRNRQSVTKMNSDKNTLVGETIYDFQGRPAVNVLPVAVDFPSCIDSISQPVIKFYPNFNQNDSGKVYSRYNFDVDGDSGSCSSAVAPMGDSISGASHYYSPANPNKKAQQAFLPDAKNYPFTQVEYTPDNTGRIQRQGGVGINHQLNTRHETKYFYGQPNQLTLDRMFGSEVGDATHYKENIVVDANGQASITYINQEGKTIATSLAGDTAIGLAKVSSNKLSNPKNLTVDLFNKNALGNSKLDTANITGNAIEFNTQLLAAYNSNYNFSYSMTVDIMGDSCLRDSICFSCVYDLEMHIYNNCGTDLLGDTLKKTIGHFTRDSSNNIVFSVICSGPTTELDSFTLFLSAGNYTISKVLTVNQQALNFYVAQYLDSANNRCHKSLNSFIDSSLAHVDTSNCHITCASCVAALGDRDAFVAAGKGTYLDYDALVTACEEPCQPKSICYVTYVQMLADMAPGGQYGGYLTSTDSINPNAFPLSVYNALSFLPKNYCGNTYTNAQGNTITSQSISNWHHPSTTLNHTTYPYYLDENGHRTSLNLNRDNTGHFVPAVLDSTSASVFFNDTTSTYYTYPENLANFSDFLAIWDDAWEAALVIYHPEYNYYLHCSTFSNTYTGNSMSSDAFDGLLQNTNTFAKAQSVGFIKTLFYNFPYDQRLNDFSSSSSPVYDPFLNHYGSFGTKLKNLLSNYQPNNTSASVVSMAEMAAFVTRCGSLYGNSDTLGCISFGAGAVDSIKNNEWQTFVGFYLSAKQKLQNQYLDSIVKSGGSTGFGYNGCFSDSNNTYNGSVALGSQYVNACQPCSQFTYALYTTKIPRFNSSPIPSTYGAATYLTYLATGQCPLAFDLQNLLNQFALNNKFKTATSQYMLNYSSFSPDIYIALGADTSHPYQKYYWNSSYTGTSVNATFNDSAHHTVCSLYFDLSSAGITNLANYKILGVSGLSDTTYSTYTNAFRAFLTLSDTTVASPTIIYKKALGYSTCFNITNCKFQQQCQPNNFAIDLQNLMSALAAHGDFKNTTGVLLNTATYLTLVTPAIKNQLGTNTTNNLEWKYSATNGILLYDVSNPVTKIILNPDAYSYSVLNSLTNINSFNHINSTYYNLCSVDILNSSNAILGSLNIAVYKIVPSYLPGNPITIGHVHHHANPISMGTCGYTTSFNCQGPAFDVQNQLQLLIHDALATMPANHDVNLTKMPSYSRILSNVFPYLLDSTSSVLKYPTSGWGKYKTQLLFTVKSSVDSCYFSLNADTIHAFDSIVDFSNLKAYENLDASGNYHQFYGIAQYSYNNVLSTDTIYGQSCLAIQTCCACGTDTIVNNFNFNNVSLDTCLSLYNQYLTAIDTSKYHKAKYSKLHGFNKISALSYSTVLNDNLCGCLSSYINYLQNYTDTTKAPTSLNNYTLCPNSDTCSSLYKQYVAAVDKSPYSNKRNGVLQGFKPIYALPYSTIIKDNLCGCLSSYIYYIDHYPYNGNVPPVSLTSYTDCPSNLGCPGTYVAYNTMVTSYNMAIRSHHSRLPSIDTTLYPSTDFSAQGFCYCVPSYTAYLQSIMDGAITPSQVDTNWLNIVNYCNSNYHPPCKTFVKPDTGNTGTPKSTFPVTVPPESSCAQYALHVAVQNGINQYNQYKDSITTIIASKYLHHCMGAFETFTEHYLDKQYHYTLYYYDQAGNLIRTVPPEGVHILSDTTSPITPLISLNTAEDSICYDRTYNQHIYLTHHSMPTTYLYNSLNQLVKQYLPDHDPMSIWEYSLPNGLDYRLKVTGVQFVDQNTGYLSGYVSLTNTITPGISKRGYIYSTSDGGKNWIPMQDVVASSLNKIQMTSNYSGYAIGNKGMILKTVDDGAIWDVVPVYEEFTGLWSVAPDWKDLYFTDSTKGVIVGTGGKSLLIDFTQANPANYIKPVSLSNLATDNLTGVTYDGSNVYASAISSNGSYGLIYKSTADPFATGNLVWNPVTGLQGTNLLDIQFLRQDSTKGFIGGIQGTLLKTSDRGATWRTIPTNVTGDIQKVYFRNDSVGVALIDSAAGYSQLYRTSNGGSTWTLTGARGIYYTDLSFYQNSNSSTVDKAYVVGKSGVISRLIASTNTTPPYYGTSFGVSPLNSPNTHVNYTSVSATNYTQGVTLKSKVIVGANNGMVYFSNNADSTVLIWDSVPIAPSSTSLTHIASLLAGSANSIIAVATGSDGNLYGVKAATAATNTVTGSSFADITLNKSLTAAYTFDNTTNKVFKVSYSGANLTATPIGSANATVIKAIAITCSGNNDLFVVGDSGGIYKDTSLISAPSWAASSAAVEFAPLNDIQADGISTAAVYAVGNNGTLLQKTPSSSTWKKITTGTTKNLNSIKFYYDTLGIIAANNAYMFKLGINTSNYAITTIPIAPPSYITQNLNDIAVNHISKQVFAVGNGGVAMYINDITAPPLTSFQIDLGSLTSNFRGVFTHIKNQFTCIGDNNHIIESAVQYVASPASLTTVAILKINEIFGQAIQKAHFTNAANGYLVGDNGFIRHTSNGQTWQLIPPDLTPTILDTLTNVYTVKPDFALVTGKQAYLSKINLIATPAPITVAGGLSATTGLNDIGFGVNSPNAGYVSGDNETMLQVNISGNNASANVMPTNLSTLFSGSGYNLRALYVFPDNSLMTVGSKGLVAFYNAGNTNWYSHAPPISPASIYNFNDVFFHDDRNGYVVGDNGVLLRWQSYGNIQGLISSTTANTNFVAKATRDSFGVTDSTKINISCVAFSSRFYGFLGGAYPDSINNANYARYLHDESGNFSTSFWYDQLGRMVVSQNSKQFAAVPKQFSYTLYDALGRIIEVGQKNDNTKPTNMNFNNIFSITQNNYTLFNGMTNQQVIYNKFAKWANAEMRAQVTRTFYDTLVFDSLPMVQQNLRKRVSSVLYVDTLLTDSSVNFNHSTHYSYDIHGNVNTLLQDNPSLLGLKQQYKRVDYDYDLISGKVNYVYYQQDSIDQFTHKYEYDADNRLTDVYTSHDGIVFDHDAKYYYFSHGPLARVEYGNNHIQGIDYAYTIQGWIKGVNSEALVPTTDIGKDGLNVAGNPNSNFARDAFGYSLTYYTNDYSPIDTTMWNSDSTHRFLASRSFSPTDPVPSDIKAYRNDLFNGNITEMVTSVTNPQLKTAMPLGSSYKYDQLNRLIQSNSFDELLPVQNVWNNENGYYPWETFAYQNQFSYDANGNILSQLRKDIAGTTFDSLLYRYNVQNGVKLQNRLYHVNDTIPASVMADDIDNQGVFNPTLTYINKVNNYSYDPIGNLVRDSIAGIAKIDWTVYGKIKSITHRAGFYQLNKTDTVRPPDLVFNYDAAGNRISKIVKPRTATGVKAPSYYTSTYYVRDAQGNVMSVYTQHDSTEISTQYFKQTEKHIYGSSRIGIDETQTQLIGASIDTINLYHNLGNKLYEMTNHLGNVLTTVSDKKIPQNPQSPFIVYSSPDVVRTTIDSLGGMRIQPMHQYGGNNFFIPSDSGSSYKFDFYINLANTNPDSVVGDFPVISYDFANANGYAYNYLGHTGHYTFTYQAPDTLFNFKILYYGTGNTPHDYMLFDSLQIVQVGSTADTIVAYTSDVKSVALTSAFGAPLYGYTWDASNYRYSFNDKEKVDEIYGSGNFLDYGSRGRDTRLGNGWWGIDKKFAKYPFFSPYCFAANNPILFMDADGKDIIINGSAEFKQQALTALQLLTTDKLSLTPEGKVIAVTGKPNPNTQKIVGTALVSQLANSKNVFNVDEVVGKEENHTLVAAQKAMDMVNGKGTGADITINVDPSVGKTVDVTGVSSETPLQIKLGHELAHSSEIDKGTVDRSLTEQYSQDQKNAQLDKNEVSTRKTENLLRREQGVTPRAAPSTAPSANELPEIEIKDTKPTPK